MYYEKIEIECEEVVCLDEEKTKIPSCTYKEMHKDVKLHSKHEDTITWWDPNKNGTTNNWWLKLELGRYGPIARWKWWVKLNGNQENCGLNHGCDIT